MQSVRQWLEHIDLPQYAAVFERNAVDLDVARDLTQQDLLDLGVEPLGHRKRLLRAIAELNGVREAAQREQVAEQLRSEGRTPAPAERRQLTVLFCDLIGSTQLAAALDPEELREVLHAYHAACSSVIAKFDGHVAQYLGDGLLVYFGYPRAHEDDAQRAVRAALAVVDAIRGSDGAAARNGVTLSVRIGIHTGSVVVGEVGDAGRHELLALGETPNLAARLQTLAEADAILISASTLRLVRGLFEIRELGARSVKGMPAALEVYQILGESAARSRWDVEKSKGFTPLIGREREVGLLLDRWQQVAEGHGEAVLINGEPGIGKSRLVQVMKERSEAAGHTLLECRCSAYSQSSQLYPIVDLLQRVLQWHSEDAPAVRLRKLEAHLAEQAAAMPELVPLVASLLGLPVAHGSLAAMPAERQRAKTIEGLIAAVLAMAAAHPVLLIVEDLHWVDPSTLELLSLLLDQIPTARLLLLLTARPTFRAPWTARSYLTMLTLNRLTHEQTERMVEHVARGKRLPVEVLRQIVAKTDGVPLFVEELTKMVQESGLLAEHADHYELCGALPPLAIPATLHDSLMARLDRLESVKAVAQLGAILGREFSYELLRAVSALDEDTLQHGLVRLLEAELLYQRGTPPQASYVFKHALVQEAAYQSVLKSSRQRHHQSVAQVLEAGFPEVRETRPELLAHHYTQAGLAARAMPWWYRAGQRAFEHSAHLEAITHLEKGLELAAALPRTPERCEQELDLLNALGLALFAIKGQASAEAGRTYASARERCAEIGETPKLFSILSGLFSFHTVRAEIHEAWEVAEQLLALAEGQHDTTRHLVAYWAIGETLLFRGEFAQARIRLEQALGFLGARSNPPLSLLSGFPGDLGVFVRCLLAHTLWHLGYPEQARCRIDEAIGLAQDLAHPFSVALARDYEAMLYQFQREAPRAQASAEIAIPLCQEQRFAYYLAWGTFIRGWAASQQGRGEPGVVQMREGVAGMRATGAALRLPYYLGLLAQTCLRNGRAEEGLALLDEALIRVEQTGERWAAAELHRLKGELLLVHEHVTAEAEACLRGALEIAREQQARSLELRCATSLGRLWRLQGKREQAHDLVAHVHGWYSEGFDTADLQDARIFLAA
jgi:class 3 adenylate cyclase/predicted ATPase